MSDSLNICVARTQCDQYTNIIKAIAASSFVFAVFPDGPFSVSLNSIRLSRSVFSDASMLGNVVRLRWTAPIVTHRSQMIIRRSCINVNSVWRPPSFSTDPVSTPINSDIDFLKNSRVKGFEYRHPSDRADCTIVDTISFDWNALLLHLKKYNNTNGSQKKYEIQIYSYNYTTPFLNNICTQLYKNKGLELKYGFKRFIKSIIKDILLDDRYHVNRRITSCRTNELFHNSKQKSANGAF